MALAPRLKAYFDRKNIRYRELPLSAVESFSMAVMASEESKDDVLQATLLVDVEGVLMAVHAFDSSLDLEAVNALTGRRLQLLSDRQAGRLFPDCTLGFVPSIGGAYSLPVLLDNDAQHLSRAIISSGSDAALVELDGRSLRLALAGARTGQIVIRGSGADTRANITLEEVAEQLQKLYRLPPMPGLALRILRLTSTSEASARELAELIEYDPSLTAQIMRYARSALFNYPGQIQSVQEAVTRVLGFDRVAHIALGIASVRAFEVPQGGMLGMDQFWRHSLHCAYLSQRIAVLCGHDKGLAYLCGLLHNFGLLLIGHLFASEFDELNLLRESNPEVSMRTLEQQVFGAADGQTMLAIGHGAIGGILHRLWQLPDAVVKAAGMHQQPGYRGEHENYVLMVQLANELLKSKGIGDEFNACNLDGMVQRLGLSEAQLERLNQDVDDVSDELDELARSLSG